MWTITIAELQVIVALTILLVVVGLMGYRKVKKCQALFKQYREAAEVALGLIAEAGTLEWSKQTAEHALSELRQITEDYDPFA